MPKVDHIDNLQQMHTTLKFGEDGNLEFVEQLSNIKVSLVHAPTIQQLRETISIFMMNTWNDRVQTKFNDEDIDRCIQELFAGEILPTGMETINLTFSIEGMDMIDTTHLIRHRLFSFSAQCHGDRDMRDDRVMVKPGIMHNEQFLNRYMNIVKQAHQLYKDMMDSGEIHGLDARTIMPRCFEHFYFARATIKDWIGFVRMRIDEQIQTTVDNIIALQVWREIVKQYPFLKGLINLDAPDAFYVKQSKKGKTNIFPPNAKNDKFDWVEEQFFHTKHRDEFPGGKVYLKLRKELIDEINSI